MLLEIYGKVLCLSRVTIFFPNQNSLLDRNAFDVSQKNIQLVNSKQEKK